MSDALCRSEPHGKLQRCPDCKRLHRLDSQGRVPRRVCVGEQEDRTAPCVSQGDVMEPIVCPTCAGRIEIKTFACVSLQVEQHRASKGRAEKLPADVASCLKCDWYVATATAAVSPDSE